MGGRKKKYSRWKMEREEGLSWMERGRRARSGRRGWGAGMESSHALISLSLKKNINFHFSLRIVFNFERVVVRGRTYLV